MYKWSLNVLTETKNPQNDQKEGDIPPFSKFTIAGISGMLTGLILQPIDLVKIRMQINGEGGVKRDHSNSVAAFKNIAANEGMLALYNGTSANLLRQAVYTSVRYGFYETLMVVLQENTYLGLHTKGFILAGFLGACAATPVDVAVVRMMADGALPMTERRNYKNVFNSLYRIGKEEGVIGLWTGTIPTIARSLIGSLTQIKSYIEIKSYFINQGYLEDNITCHFICSFLSGLICTTVTIPFDTCKTRIQAMKTENGIPAYNGLIDVWRKTTEKEGFSALWKGFGPFFIRTSKATILLFLISEKLNILYRKHVLGISDPKEYNIT